MTAVKFDISQAQEVAKHLGVNIDKAAKRAVLSTALKVVQRITTVIIPGEPRPPIDKRVYAAGWVARGTPDGAMIKNTAPNAAVIEHGARAENIKISRAMIDALAAWVKRKGLHKDGGDDPRAIAWAIAKAMQKRGIFNGGKGLKILEKGLKGVGRFFAEELKREIEREL